VRRRLVRTCEPFGLRLVSEMPGLVANSLDPAKRPLPDLDVRRVDSRQILADFQVIGSTCFHVPPVWFSEVFDDEVFDGNVAARTSFACFVGYINGVPVTTAGSVPSAGTTGTVIGIYNVATVPLHRERGCGEAITRYAIEAAIREHGSGQLVLQSTWQGLTLYERMGFRAVTRFSVYNSNRHALS
jgi:GNAT superfamily N-acetyltransferase